MRWLAASDIHGSATACRRVLEAFEREKAEGLLLLGDILYHGPRNPLPEGHDPKECIRLLNEYRNHIAAVRGNCEAAVDQTGPAVSGVGRIYAAAAGEKAGLCHPRGCV